jgi:hypothetical protein
VPTNGQGTGASKPPPRPGTGPNLAERSPRPRRQGPAPWAGRVRDALKGDRPLFGSFQVVHRPLRLAFATHVAGTPVPKPGRPLAVRRFVNGELGRMSNRCPQRRRFPNHRAA